MSYPDVTGFRHSLTITLGRTEGGGFRAELPGNSADVTEAPTVKELLERLEPKLVILVRESESGAPVPDEHEQRAISEIENSALRSDALRTMTERYAAPQAWYDEPAWLDEPR